MQNLLDSRVRGIDNVYMKRIGNGILVGMILGTGLGLTAWAGPEPIADYSKDKNIIEQKPEMECHWYISVGGGADVEFGGTEFVRSHTVPDSLGLAVLHFGPRKFDDAFDTGYRIQAEFGHDLGEHIELFGRFTYNAANGQTTEGSYVSTAFGRLILRRQFGDYTSYGGEVGLRYLFLSRQARIRPYISLSGGATRVESIDFKTSAENAVGQCFVGEVLYNGNFYGNSVVATGSILVGLEVAVTRRVAVGVDAGLRYETKLVQDDGDLNRANFLGFPSSNLSKINDNAGDRLFCPVTFYAKFRF